MRNIERLSMRPRHLRAAGAIVGLLAVWLTGCRPAGSSVLGVAPEADSAPISGLASKVGSRATVEGEMVEKCPVAGCWFVLKDASGTVRVDSKSAGFVVVDVPLHSRVRVTGTVMREGNSVELAAQGARY